MKISKKLKWGLSLLGVGIASAIPLSISLVSCSSDDDSNNGLKFGSNGIIEPITQNDVEPVDNNFDNSFQYIDSSKFNNIYNSNYSIATTVNQFKNEINKDLNNTWYNLNSKKKLDIAWNDVKNWFDFCNLYNYNILTTPFSTNTYFGRVYHSSFSSNRRLPNWTKYSSSNYSTRTFSIYNLNSIDINNDGTFNIEIKCNNVYQYLVDGDKEVSSQCVKENTLKWFNCTIEPIFMNAGNSYSYRPSYYDPYIYYYQYYISAIKITPESFQSNFSYSNWIFDESTPINSFHKDLADIQADNYNKEKFYYNDGSTITSYNFISPSLNLVYQTK